MTLLGILVAIALLLTCTMFATRQAMLGFACAIFWALAGAQSYTLSTATWDIYFLMAFACLLGMVTLTSLGAFGLREKRDSLADEEMDEEEGSDAPYIDEGKSEPQESRRVKKLHDRADRRRAGEPKKPRRKARW